MKKIVLTLFLLIMCVIGNSQNTIKLWDTYPPADVAKNALEQSALNPEITIYLPDATINTRKAVIICPGGGYSHLAMEHEGHQIAEWLQQNGYAGIVLKYRLPNKKYKAAPLEDVTNTFRYVRSKAKEWGIDKVGIAGSSAGGHLASTASTHFTDSITRPDFSILFYPVISSDNKYWHKGSFVNLLGDNPTQEELELYSNDKQVDTKTPPAILLLSDDDTGVVPQNSILYYEALKRHNIPASMYIFPVGGHGWGMKDTFAYKNEMRTLLKLWLDAFE
ncbi:MAG: alpha/beta hydrolase [Dysgonamonadaceae bacterium]|jgi:acetyl esterase/lipase|nr:alpha/beta hydrolase [Dysgonamonadaceae bacterium]